MVNKFLVSAVVLGVAVILAAGIFLLQQQKKPEDTAQSSVSNNDSQLSSADKNDSLEVDLNMESLVEKGDAVTVDYRGTLDDNSEFDSSLKEGREPLKFSAGLGQMIKGFDAAVIGMKLGEDKNIHLSPAEAYGEYDPSKVVVVPKENLGGAELFEGMIVQTSLGEAKVLKVNADSVELDFNPRLAGKALNFWIKVIGIKKAK